MTPPPPGQNTSSSQSDAKRDTGAPTSSELPASGACCLLLLYQANSKGLLLKPCVESPVLYNAGEVLPFEPYGANVMLKSWLNEYT